MSVISTKKKKEKKEEFLVREEKIISIHCSNSKIYYFSQPNKLKKIA